MLEARNISFAYDGGTKQLFTNFTFAVDRNERVSLQAPSGTGKTTLCRLLAGFEKPQGGQILLDGKPLPEDGPCPVQLIGQHPELVVDPRMRMRDTLAEAGDVPTEVIERLGIRPEWMSRFPHELSGGEMQRFCIARAIAAKPQYLIADEISTMLDAVTQAQIWNYLVEEVTHNNIGLIFVSHSPALMERIATRTIALG